MRELKLKINDDLYRKIQDASAVVGKSTDATIIEFLEDSADIVLTGSVIEIDDLETFEKLKKYTEAKAKTKKWKP